MKIAANTIVSFRYTMKTDDGTFLENTMQQNGVNYLHGAKNILPFLESKLEGLECGQQKLISISPDESPELNDSFHFDIIIDHVRAATEEEIRNGRPSQESSKNNCGPGCNC